MSGGVSVLDILTVDKLQWLFNRQDFSPFPWPLYRTWPPPNYEWLPMRICNAYGIPARNTNSSRQMVPFLFWDLLMVQILRPVFQNLPCLFSTFDLENIPRFFLDFTYHTTVTRVRRKRTLINSKYMEDHAAFNIGQSIQKDNTE